MNARAEIPSLTPLRGIAAMLVATLHLHHALFPNLRWGPLTTFIESGHLWVDFFFVLSGFIMSHVYGVALASSASIATYKQFVFARFARIYPLHLFTLGALVALELAKLLSASSAFRQPPFSGSHSIESLASNLALVQAIGFHDGQTWNLPAWSISVEWCTYLVAPLLFPWVWRRSGRASALLYVALIGALATYLALSDSYLGYVTSSIWALLRCITEFFSGVIIYRAFRAGWLRDVWRRDVTMCVLAIALFASMQPGLTAVLVVPLFGALVLAAAHNTGHAERALNVRPLRFVGEVSYSVYLVHYVLLFVAERAFRVFAIHAEGEGLSEPASWFGFVAACAVVLACSSLTYRFVEQPSRKWITRRMKPRSTRAATGAQSAAQVAVLTETPL